MNADQIELVRASFGALAAMPEVAGALFYERLFSQTPEYRALFKNDMRVQALKLMSMLEMIVTNLDRPEEILPLARDLAVRHVDYGVMPADYEAVKQALVWTLETALGDEFGPAAREARSDCYDTLGAAMLAAAEQRGAQ